MPVVRTLYDPREELIPEFESLYSSDPIDTYYLYGPEIEGKYLVEAIVFDMPGVTWVIDAEQSVIDRLTSYLPFIDTPNPLFYVAVIAYGKYAQAVAPNPTGGTYGGWPVVSRRPVIDEHSWEEFRNIEYQIVHPE